MLNFSVLFVMLSATQVRAEPKSAEEQLLGRWSPEKANAWYAQHPWMVGANFSPSNAINQLEMWQKDTFDPITIDQELGWAESLGFTSMRVFLHHLPWQEDSKGFLERIEQYLKIADRHHLKTMFVLFDDVWDPNPVSGKQREPKAGVHNSGWVQSPGKAILGDPNRYGELESYVKGIIGHYRNDPRILFWDVYNEPGNENGSSYGPVELKDKKKYSLMLLKKVLEWAREMKPSQPLSVGVWDADWSKPESFTELHRYQLEQSDVITFHNYDPIPKMKLAVEYLKKLGRPVICTEYMARPMKSAFDLLLPYLKAQKVGAYNWGFVAGKTQTNYPWDSWQNPYKAEPAVWFHDIFRKDGKPYLLKEVEFIKKVTSPTLRRKQGARVIKTSAEKPLKPGPAGN